MRGQDSRSGSLFSYVDLEQRVRSDHPLRTIRTLVNEALASLDGRFGEIYSEIGRPSIPPEQLLRAMLLQAFYSVRSERQLMEQLDFNLLFRWFVGLGVDDAVWDASTFATHDLRGSGDALRECLCDGWRDTVPDRLRLHVEQRRSVHAELHGIGEGLPTGLGRRLGGVDPCRDCEHSVPRGGGVDLDSAGDDPFDGGNPESCAQGCGMTWGRQVGVVDRPGGMARMSVGFLAGPQGRSLDRFTFLSDGRDVAEFGCLRPFADRPACADIPDRIGSRLSAPWRAIAATRARDDLPEPELPPERPREPLKTASCARVTSRSASANSRAAAVSAFSELVMRSPASDMPAPRSLVRVDNSSNWRDSSAPKPLLKSFCRAVACRSRPARATVTARTAGQASSRAERTALTSMASVLTSGPDRGEVVAADSLLLVLMDEQILGEHHRPAGLVCRFLQARRRRASLDSSSRRGSGD